MLAGIPLPVVVCAGGLALLLLAAGIIMEFQDWRKEERLRQADMRPNASWRASGEGLAALLVGLAAGMAAAYLLGEPLADFAVRALTGQSSGASLPGWALTVEALLAALVLLASGPLGAALARPRSPGRRRWVGALAGASAFSIAAAITAIPLTGLLTQTRLAGLLLQSDPYNQTRWLYDFSLDLYRLFTWSIPLWFALTCLGALIGALLAQWVPSLAPERPLVHWSGALAITAAPGLISVAVMAVVVYALLGPALENLVGRFGYGRPANSEWLVALVAGPPLLALLALQALALVGLRGVRLPSNQRWIVALGLPLVGAADLVLARRLPLAAALPVIALGLETIALGWHLARRRARQRGATGELHLPGADPYASPPLAAASFRAAWLSEPIKYPGGEGEGDGISTAYLPTANAAAPAPAQQTQVIQVEAPLPRPVAALLPAWGVSGMTAGLLAALLSLPAWIPALVVVMVDVVVVEKLNALKAPAYTPAELEGVLRVLFPLVFQLSLAALLGALLLGLLLGVLIGKLQSNLYLPLLWVSLARWANRLFYPGGRVFLAGLLGLGLGLLTALSADPQPALLAFAAALAVLAVSWNLPRPRLPLAALLAIFGLGMLGLAGLAAPALWELPGAQPWLAAGYAVLVGPCLGLASALFSGSILETYRPALRLGWLALLGLLMGLAAARVPGLLTFHAQTARFDGQFFQAVQPKPLKLGPRVAFSFFQDRQDRLWLNTQAGLLLREQFHNGDWQIIATGGDNSDLTGAQRAAQQMLPAYIQQNADGTFWLAAQSQPVLFDPSRPDATAQAPRKAAPTPAPEPVGQKLLEESLETSPEPPGEALETASPISGLASGADGSLFAATLGSGVYRLLPGRALDDADWAVYGLESGLPDAWVSAILAARDGSALWVATEHGPARWTGAGWLRPADLPPVAMRCLFEDSAGRVWACTAAGGGRWGDPNATGWRANTADPGWPAPLVVLAYFEDRAGRMWAGTEQGALVYESGAWRWALEGRSMRVFAEQDSGAIWLGGAGGLARITSGSDGRLLTRIFNQQDGLPYPQVTGLHVDAHDTLWASTLEMDDLGGALWWAAALGALLLATGFVLVWKTQ